MPSCSSPSSCISQTSKGIHFSEKLMLRSVLECNSQTWEAKTGAKCENEKLYTTVSFLTRLMVFPTLLQDVCKHCYWLESVAWLSLVKLSQAKRAMVKCQRWQMLLRYLSHNEFSLPPPTPLLSLSFYSFLSPPVLQIQLTAWPSAMNGG